jgi:hypothetical protein
LLLLSLTIARGRRSCGSRGLVLRARTLLRGLAVGLISLDGGGGSRARLYLHVLGSRRRWAEPGQEVAHGKMPSQYTVSSVAWALPCSSQTWTTRVPLEMRKWRSLGDLTNCCSCALVEPKARAQRSFERRPIRICHRQMGPRHHRPTQLPTLARDPIVCTVLLTAGRLRRPRTFDLPSLVIGCSSIVQASLDGNTWLHTSSVYTWVSTTILAVSIFFSIGVSTVQSAIGQCGC